jgi:hypothetical protein
MPVTDPDTAFCLARVGKAEAGWDTLIVRGAADTALPAEDLWAVWADLEHWPLWSPLHRSVTMTAPGGLAPGGLAPGMTFDQEISLGFPVGTTTEHVTSPNSNPPGGRPGRGPATASGHVICGVSPRCPQAVPGSAAPRRSPACRSPCCTHWWAAAGTARSRTRLTASSAEPATAATLPDDRHAPLPVTRCAPGAGVPPAPRSREPHRCQASLILPPATLIAWAGSGLVAGPETTLPFLTLNSLP